MSLLFWELAPEVQVFIPGIVLLGFAIGLLTGLFGVGGGFLMTPVLVVVFGVPWPLAVGSDLLQIFINASFSAQGHWRKGNVDARLSCLMALGAMAGTQVGGSILKHLEQGAGTITINGHDLPALNLTLSCLFLVLMTSVAVSILKEASGKGKPATPRGATEPADEADAEAAADASSEEVDSPVARWLQNLPIPPRLAFERSKIDQLTIWAPLIISFVVGIMTGLMGVGGGFILLPLLVYVFGVPTTVAVGSSAFQILFASGYGSFRAFGEGNVSLALVVMLLCGSLVAVRLGVKLNEKLGGRRIRKYFALVVGVGVLVVLYDLLNMILTGHISSH